MGLSKLQATILASLRPVVESEGFVLAGGGALIVRGEVDRATRDLDLFALTPVCCRWTRRLPW